MVNIIGRFSCFVSVDALVDFGWQHGRWTEGECAWKTRREFLHELVRTYIVSSKLIE